MIITAEGYKPPKGKKYESRRVMPGSFEGFWAVEEGPPDSWRRRNRALVAYGLEHCLTPRQKQVAEAYYYQGKKLEAIAAELGLSPSTVCRHLQAARRRLKALAEQAAGIRRAESGEATCFLGGQAL